ncbi:ABC transporter permease [Streptomyces sp. NPDC050560]|uniref:ABC transporter permease n=1 Tax=Streptomyces sp. NPDC050560 TaxID=3365630 RepID=UPI003791AB45
MSTATTTHAAGAEAPARTDSRVLRALLRSETILFRREPAAIFWIMCFPTLLLVVLGSIPSSRDRSGDLAGISLVEAYVPVSVLLSLIVAGIQGLPGGVTTYRERGILRRIGTTPVRPRTVLGVQMTIFGAAALVSVVLSLLVGRLAFGAPLPRQPGGYVLALVLAGAAALALGALVAALSRTARVAQAIGTAGMFPMMFCAGVWIPVQAMPDTLADVVGYTPFGAAARALGQAAAGDWPSWTHLGVLLLWTAVFGRAAVRWFRWE